MVKSGKIILFMKIAQLNIERVLKHFTSNLEPRW